MEYVGKSITEEQTIPYLDMQKIPELKEVQRIAYVHDVTYGTSRNDSGYVRFFLKDCNGNTTIAMLFDVEDFMMSGIKIAAFKHKPVVFKCVVQEHRGKLSLILSGKEGVRIYDGPFDYNRFIGSVEFSSVAMQDCILSMGVDAQISRWDTTAIEELARGKYGAYNRVVELAFGALSPVIYGMEENAGKELLDTFLITAEYYFRYLKDKQSTDVIGTLGIYSYLYTISQRYHDNNNKLLYLDALSAVVGSDKPKHLYAHLIKNAFENAKTTLVLQQQFDVIPMGTKTFVGGVELSKY